MYVNNFYLSSRPFFVQRGRGCSWSTTFLIFDLWIRFGDVRDQSRHQKSREILDGFLLSQILGGRPSKNCTHVITPGSRHVVWIKICDNIPISPEVIDVHTLNFKPNFKFSWLNCFGETPVPVGVCVGGQSLARVKISRRSTRKGRDIVCQKVHFSGSKLTCNSKPLVHQSSPDFIH